MSFQMWERACARLGEGSPMSWNWFTALASMVGATGVFVGPGNKGCEGRQQNCQPRHKSAGSDSIIKPGGAQASGV